MATKNNPGPFDCLTKAEPDEPMFILLARDELAPSIVRIWTLIRDDAPLSEIQGHVQIARELASVKSRMSHAKFDEAMNCALSMEEWKCASGLTRNSSKTEKQST